MELPRIKKENTQQTTREYLEEKLQGNKIPSELNGYLCESEIYTPENYDMIRSQYEEYIEENKMNWLTPIYTNNQSTFIESFDNIMSYTNDWIVSRMIVHISLPGYELNGVSLFEWADDQMIEYLHNHCNR